MNNYQPKVSTTQKHSDSQGEHIVHEGKLVLLDQLNLPVYPSKGNLAKNPKTGKLFIYNGGFLGGQKMFPIIISETEEIEVGDWVYNKVSKHSSTDSHIYQITKRKQLHNSNQSKILALPEHFSDKHLQAIVDGKMKDEDKVLVKCNWKRIWKYGIAGKVNIIYLDQQNHITLFPARQSVAEAANEHIQWWDTIKGDVIFDEHAKRFDAFIAGAEWAVKNNYKGK